MASNRSWTKSLFLGLWSFLNVTRKIFFNIIFIVLIVAIIMAISSDGGKIIVPQNAALLLKLEGDLVIQERAVDPFEEFMKEAFEEEEDKPEVLIRDVLFAIENAKHDRRIQALVLDLHNLNNAGLDKLNRVADAVTSFKQSGKPVYAIGDYFSQAQYYIASHADKVYINPMGWMLLEGYGRYRAYFKSALEKLKATTHIFKVGTYKSAIEPYIRDDMSEAAKEANQAWLSALWNQYKTDVAAARGFSTDNFDEQVEVFMAKFEAVNGDFAKYALLNGWVDGIKTREEVRNELTALLGEDESKLGFNHITFDNYLKVIKAPFPSLKKDADNIGVVVAKGTILNGEQKPGVIGGDSTAELLIKARLDDSVKAVVLHVDSPGGSAFASEIIRQEVENLKAAGKPVIAMMSTYAASGGYWISASANEIWAAPSTITGSIGVFGMLMTWEKSLDYLGIHSDGVGTTDFSGLGITRPLDPRIGNLLQTTVEHTYEQFITIVSKHRDIPKPEVDKIAQGRVWVGTHAQELGLVDKLGSLENAVNAAANLAGLETYDTKYIERTLSPKEKFWKEFFGQAAVFFSKAHFAKSDSTLMAMVKQLVNKFDAVARLNDPKGTYVYCLVCELN